MEEKKKRKLCKETVQLRYDVYSSGLNNKEARKAVKCLTQLYHDLGCSIHDEPYS